MKICLFDAEAEAPQVWQALARELKLQLRAFATWRCVEEIPDAARLLVIDQSVVSGSLSDAMERVCCARPHQLVIVSGRQLRVGTVVELMQRGVASVLEKPLSSHELLESVPPLIEAARQLHAEQEEFQSLSERLASLTGREARVLDFVLQGVSNKLAAEQLKVSVRTVESRRAKVYRKLETGNLAELVRRIDRWEQLKTRFEPNRVARQPLGVSQEPLASISPQTSHGYQPHGSQQLSSHLPGPHLPPRQASAQESLPPAGSSSWREKLAPPACCLPAGQRAAHSLH